jgi:hypothetical protein
MRFMVIEIMGDLGSIQSNRVQWEIFRVGGKSISPRKAAAPGGTHSE